MFLGKKKKTKKNKKKHNFSLMGTQTQRPKFIGSVFVF